MIIRCPNCNTRFSLNDNLLEGLTELEFTCSRCSHDFVEQFAEEPEAPVISQPEDFIAEEPAPVQPSAPAEAASRQEEQGQISLFDLPDLTAEEEDEIEELQTVEEESNEEPAREVLLGEYQAEEEELTIEVPEFEPEEREPRIFESVPLQRRGQIAAQWPTADQTSVLKADLATATKKRPKSRFKPITERHYQAASAQPLAEQLVIEEVEHPTAVNNTDYRSSGVISSDIPGCLNFGSVSEDDEEPQKILRRSQSSGLKLKKVMPFLKRVLPSAMVLILMVSLVDSSDASASKSVSTRPELSRLVMFTKVEPTYLDLKGDELAIQVTGLLKNNDEVPYERVDLSIRVYDSKNRPVGRFNLPALSKLATAKRLDLFSLDDIRKLQLEDNLSEPIRPGEERLVKIAVPFYDDSVTWLSTEVTSAS